MDNYIRYDDYILIEKVAFTCKICGDEQIVPPGDFDNFPVCYRCRAVLQNMIWKEEHNLAKKKDGELNET